MYLMISPSPEARALLGTPSIASLIYQCQLNFLQAFFDLPSDSLPRMVLVKRFSLVSYKESHLVFGSLLVSHNMPSLPEILNGDWSKSAWNRWMKGLFSSLEYSAYLDVCNHLPVSDCIFTLRKPSSTGPSLVVSQP